MLYGPPGAQLPEFYYPFTHCSCSLTSHQSGVLTMSEPFLVTVADLVAILRISAKAVRDQIVEGMSIAIRGQPGVSHKFNLADVLEWREKRLIEKLRRKGPNENDPRTRLREID